MSKPSIRAAGCKEIGKRQGAVNLNAALPLAEQVASYYRSMILNGELRVNDELPPAKDFPGVSHVTVLNAYRKLANEGLVSVQRAKRTTVAVDIEHQRYVIIAPRRHHSLYEDALFAECRRRAVYSDRIPEIFHLRPDRIESLREAERWIPGALLELADTGQIRGVIFQTTDRIRGVLKWIARRGIPYCSLSPVTGLEESARHVVDFDHNAIHHDAVRLLGEKGCRTIVVMPWLYDEVISNLASIADEFPGMKALGRDEFYLNREDAVHSGRAFVRKCCEGWPDLPDGLIVPDDIAGLGALLELKERGLKVPDDIRLLVTSFDSQILPAFEGCDLILMPLAVLVDGGLALVEDIVSGKVPPGSLTTVAHRVVPNPD